MRLLMVENHATFAAIVSRQFLGEHEVVIVPSLAAARERLRGGLFDGVLVRELKSSGFGGRIVGISSHEQGNAALLAAGAHVSCPKSEFARIAERLKPGAEGSA